MEMKNINLERMIKLADEFFAAKHDPNQISVTEEDMIRLRAIHTRTLTEESNEEGPIAWMLIIPTTGDLMQKFLEGAISEKELLAQTPLNVQYDSLYLCSALVLPELRGKGIAKRVLVESITTLKKEHPLKALFYWPFSPEGDCLAQSIARTTDLPLYQRK